MSAGMVETLISDVGGPSGEKPDLRVLPHLMPTQEIDKFFPIVRLDEGENQWAHALAIPKIMCAYYSNATSPRIGTCSCG